ncbi:MAG: hypothetical protein HZB59_07100 [Ignavibacteriales bacterium]|nr:hypothetical protein [Ignavibacteriales bacterium]
MKHFLIFFLLLSQIVFAQQRFLISPNHDAFPIPKYSSPSAEIAKRIAKNTFSTSANCTGTFNFGYPTDVYEYNINHIIYHKDVLGQWFVAKAAGTIDTVYWFQLDRIGSPDSTINIRIHRSKIGPGSGPGFGPYTSQPPCQSWGYWKSTTDADNGIAAFLSSLSPLEDTTWYSTLAAGTSFPPFDSSLFGGTNGMGVVVKPNQVIKADLAGTGIQPHVKKGDGFFISFQPSTPNMHISAQFDVGTNFATWGSDLPLSTTDENWPARNWKFYEHDSGPSNCAGSTREQVKRGWVARGPFPGEVPDAQLYSAAVNIWYSMSVTTNVPPIISAQEGGDPTNTFSNQAQTLSYLIYDCDAEFIDSAGVKYAKVQWSKATTVAGTEVFVDQADIYMTSLGSDFYGDNSCRDRSIC